MLSVLFYAIVWLMSVISIKNLSFSYAEKKVIDDISLDIEKGSYIALVGTNGSGKSTLSRIICGLLPQNTGTVKTDPNVRIGLVFQSPKDQIVSGIVSRDTAFGPQNLGLSPSEVELRTIECLNVVDLLEKANASTSALSLGQTQKTALSGMLAIWPDVLILDEAVAMIDPNTRENIFEFLRYWHNNGNTIIHITHDMDAIREAKDIILMEKGKILFTGESKAFFENQDYVNKIEGPKLEIWNGKTSYEEKRLSFTKVNYKYSQTDVNNTLENIDFSIYKGELVALTGPSGAGKSTIMELACGLLKCDSGEIYSSSRPVIAQQNCAAALFENFAADDVAFGPRNQGITGKELKQRVQTSMDQVNLSYEEFGERQTFHLSGGEQRRLAIAGILAMNSDILFFDEPTAGLDGESRYEVMQMLKKLTLEGKTVVFSTHRLDEAAFASREIQIEKGKIISDSIEIDDSGKEKAENLVKQEPYAFESTITSLRNMSLSLSGATKKKKSLIEKIPGWLRILLFLVLFVLSLAVKPLWLCFAMLAVSILYCKFADFSLKNLLKASLKILPFLLFFSVLQLIFHPAIPGEVHFTNWKWFYITPSKLIFCLATIIKTDASLACLSAFFVSTPDYDLIDGLKILLKPLEVIKIPVRYFILIIEIVFRFIPLLIEETNSIIKTQVVRGGFGEVKGKFGKLKAMFPMIIPMIIQTIKRSEALADAITMRCFE